MTLKGQDGARQIAEMVQRKMRAICVLLAVYDCEKYTNKNHNICTEHRKFKNLKIVLEVFERACYYTVNK